MIESFKCNSPITSIVLELDFSSNLNYACSLFIEKKNNEKTPLKIWKSGKHVHSRRVATKAKKWDTLQKYRKACEFLKLVSHKFHISATENNNKAYQVTIPRTPRRGQGPSSKPWQRSLESFGDTTLRQGVEVLLKCSHASGLQA